jgi:hypothetical protein
MKLGGKAAMTAKRFRIKMLDYGYEEYSLCLFLAPLNTEGIKKGGILAVTNRFL